MAILLKLLGLVGPMLVALLTVPLMAGLKKAVTLLGKLPPVAQQVLVLLISFGLTQLGALLNVAIPTDLTLFADSDVNALLSAALAMAIHAGAKARARG